MIKKMDYQLHKTPWITSLSFFEWIDGLISRLSLFMTSPDMFGQDDSCWIWKEILLLDLERNSVTGFGRKFCFSDKRKRMKSLLWQNCLQNCCIISIFTFIVQKQDI